MLRLRISPVHIYHIGHDLEGVKADAERKRYLRHKKLRLKYTVYCGYKEGRVFKYQKQPHIKDYVRDQESLSCRTSQSFPVYEKRKKIIYRYRQQNEERIF